MIKNARAWELPLLHPKPGILSFPASCRTLEYMMAARDNAPLHSLHLEVDHSCVSPLEYGRRTNVSPRPSGRDHSMM